MGPLPVPSEPLRLLRSELLELFAADLCFVALLDFPAGPAGTIPNSMLATKTWTIQPDLGDARNSEKLQGRCA